MSVNFLAVLLQISAVVSILVLILKLLSACINRFYGAKWRYFIWLILSIQLIIPFKLSLPEPAIQVNIPTAILSYPQTSAPVNIPESTAPIITSTIALPKNSITLSDLLSLIWISGVVVFVLLHFTGYFVFKKRIWRWNQPIENSNIEHSIQAAGAQMNLSKQIPAFINKRITSPMIVGLFHPALLLPDENFKDSDLTFIIRHELVHYKRHDLWYKLLLVTANAIHWFNPFIYLMVHEANRDLELSCDNEVTKDCTVEERKAYSETILSSIHMGRAKHNLFTTNFYGGTKAMKDRFKNIFDNRKKRKGGFMAAVVILSVVITGSLIGVSTVNAGTNTANSKSSLTNAANNKTGPNNSGSDKSNPSNRGTDNSSLNDNKTDKSVSNDNGTDNFNPSNTETQKRFFSDTTIDQINLTVTSCNVIVKIRSSNTVNGTENSNEFLYEIDETIQELTTDQDGSTINIDLKSTGKPGKNMTDMAILYIPEAEYRKITVTGNKAGISLPPLNTDFQVTCSNSATSLRVPQNFNKTMDFTTTASSGVLVISPYADNFTLNINAKGSAIAVSPEMPMYIYQPEYEYIKGDGAAKISLNIDESSFSVLVSDASDEKMESVTIKDKVTYLIDKEEQLRLIGSENYPLSGHYMLNSDIELTKSWIPLGFSEEAPFTGSFDGNGFTIKNIYIDDQTGDYKYVGFFGLVDGGTIHNVALENVTIKTVRTEDVVIASKGNVAAAVMDGEISDCVVK